MSSRRPRAEGDVSHLRGVLQRAADAERRRAAVVISTPAMAPRHNLTTLLGGDGPLSHLLVHKLPEPPQQSKHLDVVEDNAMDRVYRVEKIGSKGNGSTLLRGATLAGGTVKAWLTGQQPGLETVTRLALTPLALVRGLRTVAEHVLGIFEGGDGPRVGYTYGADILMSGYTHERGHRLLIDHLGDIEWVAPAPAAQFAAQYRRRADSKAREMAQEAASFNVSMYALVDNVVASLVDAGLVMSSDKLTVSRGRISKIVPFISLSNTDKDQELEVAVHLLPSSGAVVLLVERIEQAKSKRESAYYAFARAPGTRRFLPFWKGTENGSDQFMTYARTSARVPPLMSISTSTQSNSQLAHSDPLSKYWDQNGHWISESNRTNEWPSDEDLKTLEADCMALLHKKTNTPKLPLPYAHEGSPDVLFDAVRGVLEALQGTLQWTLQDNFRALGQRALEEQQRVVSERLLNHHTEAHIDLRVAKTRQLFDSALNTFVETAVQGLQTDLSRMIATPGDAANVLIIGALPVQLWALNRYAMLTAEATLWRDAFANLYSARLADRINWPTDRRHRCALDSNAVLMLDNPPWEDNGKALDSATHEVRLGEARWVQLNDGYCLSAAELHESVEGAQRQNFNLFDKHPVSNRGYTDSEKALIGFVYALSPRSARVTGGRYEVGRPLPLVAEWPPYNACTPPHGGWPDVVALATNREYARHWYEGRKAMFSLSMYNEVTLPEQATRKMEEMRAEYWNEIRQLEIKRRAYWMLDYPVRVLSSILKPDNIAWQELADLLMAFAAAQANSPHFRVYAKSTPGHRHTAQNVVFDAEHLLHTVYRVQRLTGKVSGEYETNRAALVRPAEVCPPGARFTISAAIAKFLLPTTEPLDEERNENLLFYSAPMLHLQAICKGGFKESLRNAGVRFEESFASSLKNAHAEALGKKAWGLVGHGTYFAENPMTAHFLSYRQPLTALEVAELGVTDLDTDWDPEREPLYAMLACRVVLGCCAKVTPETYAQHKDTEGYNVYENDKKLSPPYNSVRTTYAIGDSTAVVLSSDTVLALPTHLLVYRGPDPLTHLWYVD